MKDIRLIATDIDGTLLNNNKTLPDSNLDLIKEMANQNIEVVVVTSRPLQGLPKEVMDKNIIRYSISSNGAVVYDHKLNRVIKNTLLSNKEALDIIETILDSKAIISTALSSGLIGDKYSLNNINVKSEEELKRILDFFYKTRTVLDRSSFITNIKKSEGVEKIHLNLGNIEDKNEVLNLINNTIDPHAYYITSSDPLNIEITHAKATKRQGVLNLAKELQINTEQVLAIGDGENDTEMFRISKHAIAMKNAEDSVKEKANHITNFTNDEDGWSKFIKSYIFQ